MADYKTPQWLLPNEKNLAYPASGDGITGSGLSEDRHSLYSMEFDGTDDYMKAPITQEVTGTSTIRSFSMWIKINTLDTNTPIFCGFGVINLFRFSNNFGIRLGRLRWALEGLNQASSCYIETELVDGTGTAPNIGDGNWHHLVLYNAVDSNANRANVSDSKIYLDGVELTNTTENAGTLSIRGFTSGELVMGAGNTGSSSGQIYLDGNIDEFAYWDNKELNQNEINALSVANAPANLMALSSKPTAYYPLGEQAQMGYSNWNFPNGSLQSHVVDFDGTSDYIAVPNSSNFDFTTEQEITVSAWVKGGAGLTNTIAALWIGGANKMWWLFTDKVTINLGGANISTPAVTVSTDEWHHIAFTYSQADGELKHYVDTVASTTSNSGAMTYASGITELRIGYLQGGTSRYMDGQISNLQIWNTALPATGSNSIETLYNNGAPLTTAVASSNLKAWWKLNAANSSYVYPWSLELNGSPDVSGSGDHAKVVSNALQVQDINTTGTGGKVDFLTREITGAYSGINVTGEFIVYAASSGQSGATLYYKIDGGNWVQFQQELRTDNTVTTYAISGASGLTSTTSFQVKIEFETGNLGTPYVTLNNISIGGLYTEDFTNQDGAGWDIDVYTPPPVDWTFIDTETPAPNYSSALNFDGSDYVNCGNDSSLQITDNLTISVWFKILNNSGNRALVARDTGSTQRNWSLYIGTTGTLKLLLRNNTDTAYNTVESSSAFDDGKWHNAAFVYTPSTSLILYVDGVAVDTNTTSITPSINNETADFTIGAYSPNQGYTGDRWTGEISNVAVFNTSLNAAAISTLFNSGTPQTSISSSPISWWKLDNTTTGIQDSGSASNNGTNNGATQVAINVLVSNNGTSDTLPTSALVTSNLQFESPYSNYSLSFNGIDTKLSFSDITLASSYTLSAWVKRTSSSNNEFLFGNGATFGYGAYFNGTTAIYFKQDSGNTAFNNSAITTALARTDWVNWMFIKDSTAGTIAIYVDGTLAQSVTSALGMTSINTIGGDGTAATSYIWNGNIDEVAIWDTALTQAQVIQVYNNGYPNDLTSLSPSQWWRLGEDAYFVSNVITIPNKITGGKTGTGSGIQTAMLVGEAPGSYSNGLGSSLDVFDRIGDAPESTANSVSINMIPSNRISYPAAYVPTQTDNAYSMAFDGVNDYFSINSSGTLDTFHQNPFSISLWFKTSTGGTMILTEKATSSSDTSRAFYIYLSSGVILWYGATASPSYTDGSYNDGNWHHVACVAESDSVARIYVDGVDDTNNIAKDRIGTSSVTAPIILGTTYNQSGFFLNGSMDEVAIFDYALSERQIKQDIYNGTTTGKTADLNNISNLTAPIAWYRMGD